MTTLIERPTAGTMLAVATTVLIWSTTFAGLHAALRHFSPGHLVFLRWTLSAAIFVVYGAVTRMRLPYKSDLPRIALAGLLGFGAYQVLLVTGQSTVSATTAGFLINLNPVFATVIAVAMGREASKVTTWIGLALCIGGLAVMGGGGPAGHGVGAVLIVLAALCFALYTIVSKPLLARYRPLELTAYTVIAGSIPFVVFAPGSLAALRTASASDLGTLVFMAVFPGCIAYASWSRAMKGLPAGVASRFLYLIPVLGIPVAWVWVGEAPALRTAVGGLVVIAGVAVAAARRRPPLTLSAGVGLGAPVIATPEAA